MKTIIKRLLSFLLTLVMMCSLVTPAYASAATETADSNAEVEMKVGEKVKIRFSNHLANVVIDRFGKDIQMVPDDEKHFTIHTDIEVSPQFFGWVCGLGKAVRILAPAEVVEEMGDYVKGIAEMY